MKKIILNLLKSKKKNNITNYFYLSNMADWNPAEMIGVNPKPLAQSLYEKIITNNVWSKSRSLLGYQDLSKNRLMIFVAGSPYINVSLSLASLLPKQLDKKISKNFK